MLPFPFAFAFPFATKMLRGISIVLATRWQLKFRMFRLPLIENHTQQLSKHAVHVNTKPIRTGNNLIEIIVCLCFMFRGKWQVAEIHATRVSIVNRWRQ